MLHFFVFIRMDSITSKSWRCFFFVKTYLMLFLLSNGSSSVLQIPARSGPQSPTSALLAPSFAPPHCLAYLTSLSQPSVVMLYRASEQTPEGQMSPGLEPEEARKRRREEGEEEETGVKKKRASGSEECDEVRWLCGVQCC